MDEEEMLEDEGGEEEEEEMDPNDSEYEFHKIEREFQRTMVEIESNPEAIQFSDDYNKLFERLFTVHVREKELTSRVRILEEDLDNKNSMLEIATKLNETDAETITELKRQIETSWKMCDGAHAREQAAQEIIDNLRKEITVLSTELDLKNKMSQDDDEDLGAMSAKNTEGLEREKEKLANEVQQLTVKLNNALGYQEELERRNSAADLRISEVEQQLEAQLMELDRSNKMKDSLEKDIQELEDTIAKKDKEIHEMNNKVIDLNKTINKLEGYLGRQKSSNEKLVRETENLITKLTALTDDHTELEETHRKLKETFRSKTAELKLLDDETTRLRNELKKLVKNREGMEKKIRLLGFEKAKIIEDREKLRQAVANMEREVEAIKRQADNDKRAIENLGREKEILNRNLLRQAVVAKDHIKLIKIQEQSKRKLEIDLEEKRTEVSRQRKQISGLEKERDRLTEEQLDLTQKIEDCMDDVKLKKNEVFELKKTEAENNNKLRMQQNLFEAVRAERNNLEKMLQETTADLSDLKTKLKISSHQAEQLKEDISMKEQLLIKEENILRKVNKEKENLRVEVNNGLEHIKQLKEEISEMHAEEKRLHKVIMDSDRLTRQQAKDLEQLMNERDILGSQLVRRNDELSLLYEKIKILQSTLHRGEAQYDQRLEDIRLLKVEIRRLRQEKKLLSKSISNMTDLRQEIFHLGRDLTKEQLKCRALEEEMMNPLNVHRWRKLQGSDPDVLELLQKVNLLQKRLLHQSSEAIDREKQLKEVQRLYLNLKKVLEKQPGPEIKSELTRTQQALITSTKKMKCLVSELNMTELQSKEYKKKLEKVTEELNEMKIKCLQEKKMVMDQKTSINSMKEAQQSITKGSSLSSHQNKFTGGGFRMSSIQSITTNN